MEFTGIRTGITQTQVGKRARSDYVISLQTPLWYSSEQTRVVIRTNRGKVLGHGCFTFLQPADKPSLAIHVHTDEKAGGRFLEAVARGADITVSGDGEPSLGRPTNSPTNQHPTTALFYLAYGEDAIRKFVERVIVYAANVGLPQGVSLVRMIGPIPNFRDVLASCSIANGSLHGILDYMYARKPSKTVKEEIEELVRMAESQASDAAVSCMEQQEDTGYAEISDSIGCLSQALTTSDDIIPPETGLQLPRELNISSERAKDILMRWKEGQITENKAIEEVRDYVYAKPTLQKGHNPKKGPDSTSARNSARHRIQTKSKSKSLSSVEEAGLDTPIRKPPRARKRPEVQELIRLSFISNTSAEWSTTSLTTTAGLDSGAQSCSSDDSTSSAVTDNPKIHVTSISRGSLKTPITSTQLSSENVHQPCSSHDSNPNVEDTTETPNITTTEVDEMTQAKQIRGVPHETKFNELESQFQPRPDKMKRHKLQVPIVRSLGSGERVSVKSNDSGYNGSQGVPSPPPPKGHRAAKRGQVMKPSSSSSKQTVNAGQQLK